MPIRKSQPDTEYTQISYKSDKRKKKKDNPIEKNEYRENVLNNINR